MRSRPGTVLAKKIKGSDNTRLCNRCGIQRKGEGRSGPLCIDCRQVDPKWGKRGD